MQQIILEIKREKPGQGSPDRKRAKSEVGKNNSIGAQESQGWKNGYRRGELAIFRLPRMDLKMAI